MSVWSDKRIRQAVESGELEIWPFEPSKISRINDIRSLSFGQGSYGYDLRVSANSRDFQVCRTPELIYEAGGENAFLDPKHHNPNAWIQASTTLSFGERVVIIPPHGLMLARTIEYIKMPKGCIAVFLGKSSYARIGIHPLTTPFEPGWRGFVTLEIANLTPLPAYIYPGEGIGQVLFLEGDQECENSYGENGKYQNQGPEVVHAKV